MNRLHRLLLDPQGGEGDKGTPPPPPKATDFDPQVAIREAVAKHGDAERALGYFLRDNRKYRKDNQDLKARLPAEGAVVLSPDDARAWDAYKALGKAEDLRAALAERDRFRDEADGLRRAQVHKQAAEAHDFKESVLSRLIDQEKLAIEVKDEQLNGKPVKVAFVKHADDHGKPVETRLPDYARKHWSDFLPSLANKAAPAPGTPARPPGAPPPAPPPAPGRQLYPHNPL